MKTWRTIYECPCGKIYDIGTGGFSSKFFLEEYCEECGRSKNKFTDKGVAYRKWRPKLLNWFNGEWIFRTY